jgi:hypothetical protein
MKTVGIKGAAFLSREILAHWGPPGATATDYIHNNRINNAISPLDTPNIIWHTGGLIEHTQ